MFLFQQVAPGSLIHSVLFFLIPWDAWKDYNSTDEIRHFEFVQKKKKENEEEEEEEEEEKKEDGEKEGKGDEGEEKD